MLQVTNGGRRNGAPGCLVKDEARHQVVEPDGLTVGVGRDGGHGGLGLLVPVPTVPAAAVVLVLRDRGRGLGGLGDHRGHTLDGRFGLALVGEENLEAPVGLLHPLRVLAARIFPQRSERVPLAAAQQGLHVLERAAEDLLEGLAVAGHPRAVGDAQLLHAVVAGRGDLLLDDLLAVRLALEPLGGRLDLGVHLRVLLRDALAEPRRERGVHLAEVLDALVEDLKRRPGRHLGAAAVGRREPPEQPFDPRHVQRVAAHDELAGGLGELAERGPGGTGAVGHVRLQCGASAWDERRGFGVPHTILRGLRGPVTCRSSMDP